MIRSLIPIRIALLRFVALLACLVTAAADVEAQGNGYGGRVPRSILPKHAMAPRSTPSPHLPSAPSQPPALGAPFSDLPYPASTATNRTYESQPPRFLNVQQPEMEYDPPVQGPVMEGPAVGPQLPPVDQPCTNCQQSIDYWIVSTRHCPQEPKTACGCNLQVFHVVGDQQPVVSDIRTLGASIDPSLPACIFCHGSFVDFRSFRAESLQTYRWLQNASPQRLQVILFTWPSDNLKTLIPQVDVCALGRRSAINGFYMTQLIANLPGRQRLTLIGHSHGTRVVASAMQLMAGGQVQGYRLGFDPGHQRRIRVVMAAAAIDHDWLNPDKRYGMALQATECLVSLRNRHDFALSLYPLRKVWTSRALARSGFTGKDRSKLGWKNCYVHEIEVSDLIGNGHIWPHYYSKPQIAQAIRPFIYFESDPVVESAAPAPTPAVLR